MKDRVKILIVENERITALFLQKILENNNYTVTGNVSSGEEALASVKNELPSVILMDIFIDGQIDGIETASLIHLENNVPIIFTSANAENIDTELYLIRDRIDFVSKPINKDELLSKITNFVPPVR